MTTGSGPARPAPGRLTPADVVEAAVALTAERGLRATTLTAVAERLGIRLPSLYYHLPGGVDELHLRVAERVRELLIERAPPPPPQDAPLWDRFAHHLRLVGVAARTYPGVLEFLLTTGRDSRGTLSESELATRLLLESDLGEHAGEAYLIIHAYVTGWVFCQRPTPAAAREHGFGDLAALLTDAEALDQDRVLLDGLRALLTGLVATLAAEPGPASAAAAGGSGAYRALRRLLTAGPG